MSKNDNNLNFWSLLNRLATLIKSEVTTKFGRVNLVSDIILAAVVVAIFTVDILERVAITVVSIWNPAIMQYLSDASVLIAFIILVCFFVVCLIFLLIFEIMARRAK